MPNVCWWKGTTKSPSQLPNPYHRILLGPSLLLPRRTHLPSLPCHKVTPFAAGRDHVARVEVRREFATRLTATTLWILTILSLLHLCCISIMFQPPRQIDLHARDSLTCDMDSNHLSTPQSSQTLPPSASPSDTSSPALSVFSKGHTASSGSNASSIASSPARRDSFDLFVSSKRLLTDVKEEPLEREDADTKDALNTQYGMVVVI